MHVLVNSSIRGGGLESYEDFPAIGHCGIDIMGSPDLNPIEQVFAKLKHFLRKAKERSVEATWQRIGAILPSFTPQECSNYFMNAGYRST
jgi:hypothetical protein